MTPLLAWLLPFGFGAACAAAGLWRDRLRHTNALRAAEEERRHLIELTPQWLWQTDAEHRLCLWRPPLERPEGWGIAAPLGRPLWELAQAAADESADADARTKADITTDTADVTSPLRRQMQARAPLTPRSAALPFTGHAGAWTLRGRPRHDAAGRFAGYLGTAQPADGEVAKAATRTENTAAAAATAGLEDHESFVYSVSHDLRAPIRVVEGFARILKEDYGRVLDRIGNDHVDRVLAAAARMNSMMDALLALSRLQSQPLKRQPVDVSQLALYILEDLKREQPGRDVEWSIEPGLSVLGDPALLRIAIENLVGNAWKYSGQTPQARIELRRETRAGQTVYVVADNGAGFDMRFSDRLFGVFQRLHSAKDFQGTGVGLASVRRIVRRHGGDIWAESEVGKGARFYFTLG